MKKITFLSFYLVFFSTVTSIFGQTQFIENEPCSGICLPLSGTVSGRNPAADGFSPNVNLPCGAGTSEDNPLWFKFVPKTSSMTFTLVTSNCTVKDTSGKYVGFQFTIFEGYDCGSISSIGCIACDSKSNILTVTTVPNQIYWIQIDGCGENVCDFTFTYDATKLSNALNTFQNLVISTPQSCKGENTCYNFSSANQFKMNNIQITPASAGTTTTKQIVTYESLCVLWKQAGAAKICGNVTQTLCNQSSPSTQVCFDIIVNNAMDTTNLPEPPLWEHRGVPSISADKFIFDPSRQKAFYGVSFGKSFFSKDNGATFNFVKTSIYTTNIFPTIDSNVIYLQSNLIPYKSTDGGKNWVALNKPPFQNATLTTYDIFVNPNKPDNVIAEGVDYNNFVYFTSKDKGQTWVQIIIPNLVGKMHISYNKDKFFFLSQSGNLLANTTNFVNYSTNFLSNFEDIVYGNFSSSNTLGGIQYYAISANDNKSIFTLNTEQSNAWILTPKFKNQVYALSTATFSNPNEVYASVADSVTYENVFHYKSTDTGKTWKQILKISTDNKNTSTGWIGAGGLRNQLQNNTHIHVHPFFSNKIIFSHSDVEGFEDGYLSADSGTNLEQIYVNKTDENKPNNPTSIAKEYGNTGVSVGGTYLCSFLDKDKIISKNWQTKNDGKTWKPQEFMSKNNTFSNVVKHPTKNIIFTINVIKQQLLYSLDEGNTWQTMTTFPFSPTTIALNPLNPNIMYVGGQTTIWKTENLEQLENSSWNLYYEFGGTVLFQGILDIKSLKDGTLLVALDAQNFKGGYSPISKEYYVKEPNATPARLIDYSVFSELIIDPFDALENTFYATGSADGLYYKYPVVVSKDRGKTWKAASSGNPRHPNTIAVNPLNSTQVFVGASDGIWVSDNINDICTRWKKLKNYDFTDVISIKFNPYEKDELWAVSTHHGIQKAKVPNALLFANATSSNQIDCKNVTSQIKISPFSQTQPNSPLTFSWSGPNNLTSNLQQVTVFPLVTSKYYVTVTNAAGQKAIDSVTVFVDKTLPNVTLKTTPANAIVCSGKTITIEAQTASLNYVWSNGVANKNTITVDASGKYFVTVTGANACTNSASAEVTVSPALQKATQSFFIFPASKTLKVTLLAVAKTSNPSVTSTTPAFVLIKETPGVYTKKYTYTDQNGCTGNIELNMVVANKIKKKPGNKVSKENNIQLDETLANLLLKEGVSLEEITFDAPMFVFPNPSNSIFNIAFADETLDFSAEIFDMTGKKVFSAQNQTKIDLSSLPKGNYLLKVATKEDFFTQVLILQ